MSEGFETAVAEYEQELGIRPGTLCAYDVEGGGVVDLTDDTGTLDTIGVEASDRFCPWKQIALVEKRRPPTWDLADRLIAEGVAGVRVPSTRTRGLNLVLWHWNAGAASPRVIARDPLGDLPRDQSSWPAP
jgi:RES domain-containing protein